MALNKSTDESEKRTTEYKEMMDKAAKESDRGFIITAAAILDFYLERVIKAFLIDVPEVRELFENAYAPLGDMSGKIKAAYLMGLVTKKESDQINAIRRVRNVFAHQVDASFTHPHVRNLCQRPPISNGKDKDRDALIKMSIDVGVGLIHRDIEITRDHKRKPRTEPKPMSLLDP
jgi:DNA-binding MltR family transcriptional regulator